MVLQETHHVVDDILDYVVSHPGERVFVSAGAVFWKAYCDDDPRILGSVHLGMVFPDVQHPCNIFGCLHDPMGFARVHYKAYSERSIKAGIIPIDELAHYRSLKRFVERFREELIRDPGLFRDLILPDRDLPAWFTGFCEEASYTKMMLAELARKHPAHYHLLVRFLEDEMATASLVQAVHVLAYMLLTYEGYSRYIIFADDLCRIERFLEKWPAAKRELCSRPAKNGKGRTARCGRKTQDANRQSSAPRGQEGTGRRALPRQCKACRR